MSVLYRVAAYDSAGLREASRAVGSRALADECAAALIRKHARVVIQDDALEVVAEWVDGEERGAAVAGRPCECANGHAMGSCNQDSDG